MRLKNQKQIILILALLLSFFSGISLAQTYQPVSGDTSGYTPGNFNVTDAGSANYSIPIVVSPGTSGVQPSLSIGYNSQGGNGLLGIGWSLQGLSAISRTSQTKAQDGQTIGINFSQTDRFSLDGERLVLTNQSNPYGGNGVEYRTEQNAFYKIVSYGNVGNNAPAYFKVFTNSGLIMEYGNTNDSRIEIGGNTPIYWLVNKVSDTKGNYFTISYTENTLTGEYFPLRIDYTGNDNANLAPYCSIQFDYETRQDSIDKYLNGINIQASTKRLNKISCYYNNSIVRSYTLNYQYSPANLSELISIKECGMDGHCHTPTTFTWTNINSQNFSPTNINYVNIASSQDKIACIDINSDGVQDIVKIPTNANLEAFVSNKSPSNLGFVNTSWNPVVTNTSKISFADFNGDGKQDILRYSTDNGTNSINLNSYQIGSNQIASNLTLNPLPASILTGYKQLQTFDINADGRSDILCFDYFTGTNYWLFSETVGSGLQFLANGNLIYFTNILPTSLFTGNYEPVYADFNSDGLTDILFWNKSNGNNLLYKNNGGSPVSFTLSSTDAITPSLISGSGVDLFTPDFNADGQPDILFYNKADGTNRWWINKGNNIFTQASSFPANLNTRISGGDYLLNIDFNADGLSDLIWIEKSSGTNRWFVGNGKLSYTELSGNIINPTELQNYTLEGLGNFTSKSLFDICLSNYSLSPKIKILRGGFSYNNLISKITVGSGQTIQISYDYLTNDSIYDKRQDAIYPLMDYQASQFVVKSYKTDDGVGSYRSMGYKYVGAKVHINGRGFRGFSEVHMTDEITGIVQSKYYLSGQDSWKYINSPLIKSTTKLANGIIISQTDIQNALVTFYSGKCNYSNVARNSSKNYEIDGTFIDSTVTTYTYDDYGNILTTVNDYGEGLKDSLVNQFSNYDTPNGWLIGRLDRADLYRYAPNQPVIVKSCAFQYDIVSGVGSGLLVKEISEPDSGLQTRIEKTYQYDAFGNITESSTTAWNGYITETRSNITTYDNLGRFVLSATNALGHIVTKTYEPKLGLELTETDPNGLTTQHFYDGFGRKTKTITPDGNWVALDYRKCNNTVNCPPYSYYLIYQQTSTGPHTITFYDLYNRELREQYIGFNGADVYVDIVYNDRGLVAKKSDPYFSNQSPIYTTYHYDISGRKTADILPGNRIDSVYYAGRTTMLFNALGQKKTVVKDAKEQMVKCIDNQNHAITYTYSASGNLIEIKDHLGNQIQMKFDIYGNKTELKDPDLGTYKYVTNRFGETVKQIDPLQNVVLLEYDKLDRLKKRTEPEGITNWVYDSQPNGIGMLASVTDYAGYTMTVTYDNLSRKIKDSQTIDGNVYNQQYTYDSKARIKDIIYPSGFSVTHVYNANAYLSQIKNTANNNVYWTANTINAKGLIEKQTFGNAIATTKVYDSNTNFLLSIKAKKGNAYLQTNSYTYDLLGNLLQREDSIISKQESLSYDNLNRLLKSKVVGGDSILMQYDDLGNILSKSDVGTYQYGAVNAGPHQVQSINITTNQCIPSLLIETSYNSFNKVKQITKDSIRVDIQYGPQRARYMQKMYVNDTLKRTKYYVSGVYEKEIKDGVTSEVHYIRGPENVIAVYTTSNNNAELKYLHRDHLGSIAIITNDTGSVVGKFSYDAWGKRRNADWSNTLTDTIALSNDRGFTGHEHYDLFDLIDMNGRIYDPVLARFLSADPYIQDPTNLQNLNRYTYVLNNPLSYTDPSGFFFGGLFKAIGNAVSSVFKTIGNLVMTVADFHAHIAKVSASWVKDNWKTLAVAAVAITVSVFTCGAGAPLLTVILSGAASGFASSATATLLNGGNIGDALKAGAKGALVGGVTAGLTFGVGSLAAEAGNVGGLAVKVVGHGVVQGGANVVNGGKFEHGFISGAITAGASKVTSGFDSRLARIASSAIVGGTTSVLTGGKFDNGAITGAFIMIYNDECHKVKAWQRPEAACNAYKSMKDADSKNPYRFGDKSTETIFGDAPNNRTVIPETTIMDAVYPVWCDPPEICLPTPTPAFYPPSDQDITNFFMKPYFPN